MATSIATFQAILKFCATKNLFKKTTLFSYTKNGSPYDNKLFSKIV